MKKTLILLLMFGISSQASNIDEIRDILKHVETNHNPNLKGDNGHSWGILQIQQGAIDDVNRRYGTDYTHQDAFDINCAEEIFALYIKRWTKHLEKKEHRKATTEDIVRIWNGGPRGYKRKGTLAYLKKYKEYKTKLSMNKRKCIVGGKMGEVMSTYTHTMDVYMFKSKKMVNVNKSYIKLLPKEAPKNDPNQLKLVV